jgi:hypothetical protein
MQPGILTKTQIQAYSISEDIGIDDRLSWASSPIVKVFPA